MGANGDFYNSPNSWPYTNFHELNLDWVLEKLKEMETDLSTDQQTIDATNRRIDETNTNVSNLSKQNLSTLEVAEHGRAVHNYFDNSDFTNPVNQRGKTTYNSAGYCIDRWFLVSGSVTIGNSGITLTGATFGQRVALKAGIYTFQFHLSTGTTLFINVQYDGTSSVTQIGGEATTTGASINAYSYSPGIVMFQFIQDENAVHTASWAALYKGSYTASGRPDYVPKGYAVELAECQIYFERLGVEDSTILGGATFAKSGAKSFIISIQYQPKRISRPTLSFSDVRKYRLILMDAINDTVFSAAQVSSFDEILVQSPFASFRVNITTPLDRDCVVILQRQDNSDGAYIDVNADL